MPLEPSSYPNVPISSLVAHPNMKRQINRQKGDSCNESVLGLTMKPDMLLVWFGDSKIEFSASHGDTLRLCGRMFGVVEREVSSLNP